MSALVLLLDKEKRGGEEIPGFPVGTTLISNNGTGRTYITVVREYDGGWGITGSSDSPTQWWSDVRSGSKDQILSYLTNKVKSAWPIVRGKWTYTGFSPCRISKTVQTLSSGDAIEVNGRPLFVCPIKMSSDHFALRTLDHRWVGKSSAYIKDVAFANGRAEVIHLKGGRWKFERT